MRHSISRHARWCFLFNGTHLRVLDAGRTFARRHIEFDLEAAADSEAAARLLAMLASAESVRPTSLAGVGSPLASIVAASDAHGQRVCTGLRDGVHQAIERLLTALGEGRRRPARSAARDGLRAGTHGRVPHPVPLLCRGPRPGADMAPGVPRCLHDGIAAHHRRERRSPARAVGDLPGHLAPRTPRVRRRRSACDRIQRAPLRTGTRPPARPQAFAGYRRARGRARVVDDSITRRHPRARVLSRSGGRGARRGLRGASRLRTGNRAVRRSRLSGTVRQQSSSRGALSLGARQPARSIRRVQSRDSSSARRSRTSCGTPPPSAS